jgi:anti-sigma regulatory factor (Ser/Thr protein kinase)
MEVATHTALPVVESSQPSAVRFAARRLVERAGFSEADSYRTGLVATELATNLVKHAHGGEILMRVASDRGVPEIEFVALDRGPGIANLSAALADGQSTTGTTGIGLGAIQRLSDEFDIHSCVPHGTAVLARLRPAEAARRSSPFVIAGMSVAKSGETECGDAWTVDHRIDDVVAIVADGLGHGPFAAQAAGAVVQSFRDQHVESCAQALQTAHDNVRHTRGAAAAVAYISRSMRHLRFAGVGNIAAAVLSDGSMRHVVSHNGTLGHATIHVREYTYPWPAQALLVMHSDGLVSHWSLDRYPGLRGRHPALIAGVLYRDFSRGRDDVTIVVGREAA